MQKAKNIITLPLKGYKNNYKSYQQRIAIQENKTQWCITAHSHQVHPTLGFSALPGGAGGQGQPCSSEAPEAGSARTLAISPCLWADHHNRECQLDGVARESDQRHRSSRIRSSTNCQSSGPVGSLLIRSPKMTRRTDMTYFTSLQRIKWEIVHIRETEKAFSEHKGLSSHPGYRRYFLYVP